MPGRPRPPLKRSPRPSTPSQHAWSINGCWLARSSASCSCRASSALRFSLHAGAGGEAAAGRPRRQGSGRAAYPTNPAAPALPLLKPPPSRQLRRRCSPLFGLLARQPGHLSVPQLLCSVRSRAAVDVAFSDLFPVSTRLRAAARDGSSVCQPECHDAGSSRNQQQAGPSSLQQQQQRLGVPTVTSTSPTAAPPHLELQGSFSGWEGQLAYGPHGLRPTAAAAIPAASAAAAEAGPGAVGCHRLIARHSCCTHGRQSCTLLCLLLLA